MTFIFNVFLIRGASFQNCAATNKGTLASKHALILRNIIYPWLTGQYLLPSKKNSFFLKFNAKKIDLPPTPKLK
jgi:hypothetical protein